MLKAKVVIEIEGKFGSDFQRETYLETVEMMIMSANQFRLSTHKQNKITSVMKVDGEVYAKA